MSEYFFDGDFVEVWKVVYWLLWCGNVFEDVVVCFV